LELAKAKRQELIEALADVDDAIGDLYLAEEEVTIADLVSAIRRATISLKFSPVFLGSAIKNTGVQPMLDGVCAYLPDPRDAIVNALDLNKPDPESSPVQLIPAADGPLVGLAFKLEEGRYGQLTYMRVYQGTLRRGSIIYNARTGKKLKVPRLVKMHSNDMEVCDPSLADPLCSDAWV
jgi:elongation factor G